MVQCLQISWQHQIVFFVQPKDKKLSWVSQVYNYLKLYIGTGNDINFYFTAGVGFTGVDGNRPYYYDGKTNGLFTNYSLSFNNNFEDGLSGGKLYFDSVEKNAPYSPTLAAWTWPHSASAKTPQTMGNPGYTRIFYEWRKNNNYLDNVSGITELVKESANYEAKFHKYYDVTIANELPGYSNQGNITVSGTSRNSPYPYELQAGQQFSASGITQTIDQVTFTFSYWKKDGQTTYETSPFTPTTNSTYTAVYSAKPVGWNRAIQCTSAVYRNIVITWNDHPSTGVTYYQIWRKVRYGVTTYLGDVNRGVRTFTDPDYLRSDSPADSLIQYDVRPYFSPSGTFADPEFSNVTYGILFSILPNNEAASKPMKIENEVFNEYSLSNFPNPFNPNTIITYQLPEKGFVNLSVFNSLGEKVCEPVNGIKEQGIYQVNFNGTNLASGIYFYCLKTDSKVISKKMLLIK